MKEKLTEEIVKDQVTKWMEEGIQSVITGKVNSVSLLHTRPSNIIDYVQSIGGEWDEEIDTNGWQWDYWFKFEINGKKYTADGDAFYSSYASFELAEED